MCPTSEMERQGCITLTLLLLHTYHENSARRIFLVVLGMKHAFLEMTTSTMELQLADYDLPVGAPDSLAGRPRSWRSIHRLDCAAPRAEDAWSSALSLSLSSHGRRGVAVFRRRVRSGNSSTARRRGSGSWGLPGVGEAKRGDDPDPRLHFDT